MIRGIGPVYAKKMVKAFGEKVFDVIEAEPDRLREVTGIGTVRAKRDAWAEQKIVRKMRTARAVPTPLLSYREVNRAAEIPADARPHVAAGALVRRSRTIAPQSRV